MTDDNNQPIDDQPVSPHQRVLKVAPQVHYGRPNPQLMRIHADDVQGTLPQGESPEEHGGELVGYSPVFRFLNASRTLVDAWWRRWRTWRWLSWRILSYISCCLLIA